MELLSPLPPLIHLLETTIEAHRTRRTPGLKEVSPGAHDIQAIRDALADKNVFDVLGLRAEMWGDCSRLRVFRSSDGNHLILLEKRASPVPELKKLLELWSLIFAMFSIKGRPARVIWFAHPLKRSAPRRAALPPGPESVNGGYCTRGHPDSIIIYRKEDATRVLIHELLHATGADTHAVTPTSKDIPFIEATTEAWAEVIYALLIDGREGLQNQISYAVKQNELLIDIYGGDGAGTPAAYIWRYTIGREECWKRLGIVPGGAAVQVPHPADSLCLTARPLPAA